MVNVSVACNHLVVVTLDQLYVYSLANINTPAIFDALKGNRLTALVQSQT